MQVRPGGTAGCADGAQCVAGGQLRAGCDAWDAILATTAPAMLTGTPRRHALAAIEALEASPRGWYGGLGLQVSADGDALVGTLLRAATLRANTQGCWWPRKYTSRTQPWLPLGTPRARHSS